MPALRVVATSLIGASLALTTALPPPAWALVRADEPPAGPTAAAEAPSMAGASTPAEPTAQPAPSAQPAPRRQPRVDVLLQRRRHDARLGHNVAFIVTDARTGEVLSSHRPTRPMQGASNMKILTAVTAIARLGPSARFTTTVLRGARPRHVVLRGGGDPLLTRHGVQELARRTARVVSASRPVTVHVDARRFPAATRAPGWVDAYLGSSVGMVQALAMRGDRGRHPSASAAAVFVSALRARGVDARLGPRQPAPSDADVIAKAPGHTVAEAVAVMLSESESNVAEVLFRQVALAAGRPATWAGSQRAARETLVALGIDVTGARLVDGSGLSRLDRISPRLVADVLRLARVSERERFAALFRPRAMPVAGRTGTLTQAYGRYSTAPSRCARGDVQAKTGTILGTIALSGVADTVFGGQRIFSVIVNDRPQRYAALSTRRAVDGLAATVTGCWD